MSFNLSYMSSPITTEIILMIKESMYKAGIDVDPIQWTLHYFIKMSRT